MAQFNLNPDPPPDCFGKSWNPKDVLCAGGADITYRDDRTGSHVRPQCDYYSSCGARVAHTQMEQSRLMPAQNLVRSPTPQPATPQASAPPSWMSPTQMQQWMNEQAKTLATQMFQQMQQYPQTGRNAAAAPYGSPPYPQGGGYFDPRFQPMPVNYQMPAYLTVPEERFAGDSLFVVLFRTIFRSVLKAGGHSFSHFWDTMPMGRPPMPPPGAP